MPPLVVYRHADLLVPPPSLGLSWPVDSELPSVGLRETDLELGLSAKGKSDLESAW